MNVRLLLLSAIVVTLLTGCRRDPYLQVYIDNMNAEKRMLEDTLYDLQHDYDTQVAEVDKLREELEALKSGGVSPRSRTGAGSQKSDSGTPRNLFPNIPELKPPTIDEGLPSENAEAAPTPATKPDPRKVEEGEGPDDLEPPKLDLGGAGESLSAVPLPDVPMPSDQQITQLHLDPARTGGFQQDDQPGDDGIVVVLQPRNKQQDFVPLPGRVSVVLLDEESRSRVARWEFTPAETKLAMQRSQTPQGIELTMPWQETPPDKSRLHLFVRYWLPDGSTVQQDTAITIAPNGQLASRWTPRSQPRADIPARGLNVAENPEAATRKSQGGSAGNPPAGTWEAARESAGNEMPAKQARRPEWRPYR